MKIQIKFAANVSFTNHAEIEPDVAKKMKQFTLGQKNHAGKMPESFKIINLAELARRMGRSRQWFYQRLNGNIVNGKPAQFTEEERAQIAAIFEEIRGELSGLISFFGRA